MTGSGPKRLLALLLLALAGCGSEKTDERSPFARSVDLSGFGELAVLYEGRLKSFDSFAREILDMVSGPRSYRGQSAAFTYLDLALRPEAYEDADIVYVKNKPMRARLARALRDSHSAHHEGFEERLAAFVDTGLLSEHLLRDRAVEAELEEMRANLVTTAKFVDRLDSALFLKDPRFLHDRLRVVPPMEGDEATPWLSLQQLVAFLDDPAVQSFPVDLREPITEAYLALHGAWREQQAETVNASLERLTALLPAVNPELYPSPERLSWQSWYVRARSMTWVWLLYLPSVILLLLALVYRWRTARRLGLAVFTVAFGFHTFALGLRWYVSGRFPNTNMFEAVTTAAWFGAAVAVLLEIWARRSGMRNLFALGSAVAAMVALMAAHFLPVALNANISNRMPVLHDVWLYIHTNVIIASYCLIFMAAVSALLYLVRRVFTGRSEYARLGGAGSLIVAGGGGGGGDPVRASKGEVLDGVTMVLMELSFVMLWAGLVMGAIWADHSWGRPWGWDPKEVFALCTFLIFALLVHVRFKSRDKGLWTAVLAVVGAGVMLFNWIVINFVITGLHSYA